METTSNTVGHDIHALAQEASALLAATAHVADEHVSEVRKRLSTVLEAGKKMCDQARDRAVAGVDAAGKAMHEHPYQAVAIGVGLGAAVGYLVARSFTSRRDG